MAYYLEHFVAMAALVTGLWVGLGSFPAACIIAGLTSASYHAYKRLRGVQ